MLTEALLVALTVTVLYFINLWFGYIFTDKPIIIGTFVGYRNGIYDFIRNDHRNCNGTRNSCRIADCTGSDAVKHSSKLLKSCSGSHD